MNIRQGLGSCVGTAYAYDPVYTPSIPWASPGQPAQPVDITPLRAARGRYAYPMIAGVRAILTIALTTGAGGAARADLYYQLIKGLRINTAMGEWINISSGAIAMLANYIEYGFRFFRGTNQGASQAVTVTIPLRIPFPMQLALSPQDYRVPLDWLLDGGTFDFDYNQTPVGPGNTNQYGITSASVQWMFDIIDEKVYCEKTPWRLKDFSLNTQTELTLLQIVGRLRWAQYFEGLTGENTAAGPLILPAQNFQSNSLGWTTPQTTNLMTDQYVQAVGPRTKDAAGALANEDPVLTGFSLPIWTCRFRAGLSEMPEVNGFHWKTDGAAPASDARLVACWVPDRRAHCQATPTMVPGYPGYGGLAGSQPTSGIANASKMANGQIVPHANMNNPTLVNKLPAVAASDYGLAVKSVQ